MSCTALSAAQKRHTPNMPQEPPPTVHQERNKAGLTARIVSGSIGSIVTSLVVTPLEVVKVRIQAASASASSSASSSASKSLLRPCPQGCGKLVLYNGHLDCVISKDSVLSGMEARTAEARQSTVAMMRTIFAKEGWAGTYAGLRPTLAMAVPNTVMYFAAYDELVWYGSNPMVAGAIARMMASTVTSPLEYVRTRQAVGGAAVEWRTAGLNLFQGLRPTLWRDVPFSALYWGCVETFRAWWKECSVIDPSPAEQAAQAFCNGALAGMISAAATTPFDVLKTRQQSRSLMKTVTTTTCQHGGAAPLQSTDASNTFGQLRQIAQTEGLVGLWRGNLARMLKVAPSCAIMISTYEFGKRILD